MRLESAIDNGQVPHSFVLFPSMEPYINPNIRILTIRRQLLTYWDYNHCKVFSFWRLYWNSNPGARIIYKDRVISLTPEKIVLVPAHTGIRHRLDRDTTTHFYAHFFADAPFDRLSPEIYVFKTEPGMLTMLKSMPLSENSINALGPTMAVYGLIYSLLARIPDTAFKSSRIPSRMAENISFIEAHIQKSVSNKEIARHMGASVNTMLRHYQHELGMTPQAYLRQKRIEKACALLHDPQKSIKQIAEETGFCDQYYFFRTFKALQNITPAQYRRHSCTR